MNAIVNRYPIKTPSGIPGSGNAFYLYLILNSDIPGELPHLVWYNGLQELMKHPEKTAFRGFFPIGGTYKIKYGGSEEFHDHIFTGEEKNAIFVGDLSDSAKDILQIPISAKPDEKVFNPNFREYKDVSEETKLLNKLPTIALAKSISGWLCQSKGAFYSETDVADFLTTLILGPSSSEMMYVLHANHIAWCSHTFTVSGGQISPDLKKEFYSNNSPDFYVKDIGTIMPSILFSMAMLGLDIRDAIKRLSYDLWDIDKVANTLHSRYLLWTK